MSAPREHDAEVDALYQLPPAEFVAARTALAKKLGKGVAASLVRDLPKPTVSAWIVNRLYAERRGHFDALLAAGEALRGAHVGAMTAPGGAALREATEAQRHAVQKLVDDAETMLRAEGAKLAADSVQRARESLRAISTRGGFGEQRAGRLSQDVPFPDFVELLGGAALPSRPEAPVAGARAEREKEKEKPPPREKPRAKKAEAPQKPRSEPAAKPTAARATSKKEEARERRESEARARAERARAKKEEAARKAAELAERKERERREQKEREASAREEARKRVAEAKTRASSAREQVEGARAAVAEARRALASAEAELSTATRAAEVAERALRTESRSASRSGKRS